MWKGLPILLGLTTWMSCRPASLGSSTPLSAGVLSEEYERSGAVARSKYDGKEIIVTGYVAVAAKMPLADGDQGSVSLKEKGKDAARAVTCWFSQEQAREFSRIKGGQYITVKGVFNGEAGVELKFCKLVKLR